MAQRLATRVGRHTKRAFLRAVELASEAGAWLLVTGSLYLVGALRREVANAAGQ